MNKARAAVFFICAFLIPTSFLPVSAHAQKPNVCKALSTNDLAGCTNAEISVWLQTSLTKLNAALTAFDNVVNANIETRCLRLSSNSTVTIDDLNRYLQKNDSRPETFNTSASCFPKELSNPCLGRHTCDYFRNFLNSNFVARFGDAYAPAYETLLADKGDGACPNEICWLNYGKFERSIVILWFSRQKEQIPALLAAWTPVYDSYQEYSSANDTASVAITANGLKKLQGSVSKGGNCMFDTSNIKSQIGINGKTYVWPNGDRKLCAKGRWVSKEKTPLTALYLTCAIFNSQSDRGCYVKDSHGGLTWLFNLPDKQIIGKPVSSGSYYTENGYCKVTLYQNFAYRDSCG